MPVRLLRPTIRTSERWHRARYFDRCFWISLLALVDDYGRYEGTPALLASECFPYGDENGLPMTTAAIDGALRSLANKGLLIVYKKGTKQYIQFTRWDERKRSSPKFPDPESKECEIVWKSEDCEPLLSFASNRQQPLASPPSPSPSPSPTTTPTPSAVASKCVRALKKEFEDNGKFQWLSETLCKFYKRPRPEVSMGEEQHLVAEISRRPGVKDEWVEIRNYRQEIGEKFFPQSLKKLCQEWESTLDKARNHRPAPKPYKELSIGEKEIDRMARAEGVA